MSDIRSLEEMMAEAEALGCNWVLPAPNELFVDIDSDDNLTVFELNLPLFEKLHPVARIKKTPSKSPGHFHIVVTLSSPIPGEIDAVVRERRIYWQLLLGSDPVREMLALHHMKCGHPPTVFFEPKPKLTVTPPKAKRK